MLKVFLQSRFERIRHLMKAYELANSHQLRMISGRSRIEPLNDRTYVTKNRGIHQGWFGMKVNLV